MRLYKGPFGLEVQHLDRKSVLGASGKVD